MRVKNIYRCNAAVRCSTPAPPSPPRNVRVTETARDYVILAWEAPQSDGNEKLLGYEVEKSMAGGGGSFVSAGYVDVGTLSFRVTRLHEGCDYMFRVSAENRVGLSQPAATERPVTVKLPFGESFFAARHVDILILHNFLSVVERSANFWTTADLLPSLLS